MTEQAARCGKIIPFSGFICTKKPVHQGACKLTVVTEPRVEAGDRALETARKIAQAQKVFDRGSFPLPVAEIAALIQSAMNAQERNFSIECPKCKTLIMGTR